MNALDYIRLTYPRVSDIIGKQNEAELRGIPLDILANASIRGTEVHNHCTAIIKGLWPPEINPEYQPYVDAFIDWYKNNVYETLYAGVRLYNDVKRFTGEFDLIVILKETNQVALIDIKTSCKASKTWPIQLAAYKHLCEINGYINIDTAFNVHLKKTKSAVYEKKLGEKVMISPPVVKALTIEHKNLNPYWEIFSSALACYDYFDRKEVADVSV